MKTPLSQDQLNQLVGMRARLWHFMASHDHLAIWLTDGSGLSQYLVLSGCNEISAPVAWRVTQPRLVPDDEGFLEFVDQGVRIICQDASIHAEYKTHCFRRSRDERPGKAI